MAVSLFSHSYFFEGGSGRRLRTCMNFALALKCMGFFVVIEKTRYVNELWSPVLRAEAWRKIQSPELALWFVCPFL